jgi:uncharacterized protein
MPVEFALRPRIRLREDFAEPPRRRRLRLPKLALPVLAYWAVIGGITYGLVHAHDTPAAERAAEPSAPPVEAPAWSEPAPLPAPAAVAAPERATVDQAASEPQLPAPALPSPRVSAEPTPQVAAERAATTKEDEPPTLAPAPAVELTLAVASSAPRSSGALPSCEAAAAAATQDLDFASSDRTADLPSAAIASVLENGAWLSTCSVPASTSLDVCVAIKGGRVTAATVVSSPVDSSLNACVKQRAAALQFPYSARLDIARTRF